MATFPIPRVPIITPHQIIVVAPITGIIMEIKKRVGNRVRAGDTLLILEAMKMENEITAPKSGKIKEVRVSDGTAVNEGDILLVIG